MSAKCPLLFIQGRHFNIRVSLPLSDILPAHKIKFQHISQKTCWNLTDVCTCAFTLNTKCKTEMNGEQHQGRKRETDLCEACQSSFPGPKRVSDKTVESNKSY